MPAGYRLPVMNLAFIGFQIKMPAWLLHYAIALSINGFHFIAHIFYILHIGFFGKWACDCKSAADGLAFSEIAFAFPVVSFGDVFCAAVFGVFY